MATILGSRCVGTLKRGTRTFLPSLEKHKALFDAFRLEGGEIEFFIGWFSDGNTGDTFSYKLLKKLGDLNIDLALDVYDGPPSEKMY
jgi:hypothetical protein